MLNTKTIIKTSFLTAALALFTMAQPASAQQRDFLPPMMGWGAWNAFGQRISEENICSQADWLVKLGLDKLGYKYVCIDDGFWDGRNDDGTLRLQTKKFPNGMRKVADYIHSKGLKAGIYSDAGDNTCASRNVEPWGLNVGLAGHEYDDCKLYFADWDYDYIKVDYCGGNNMGLDERKQYTKIGDVIKRIEKEIGKNIVYNVCRWEFPGTWITRTADSWRTTADIIDSWEDDEKRAWGWGLKHILTRARYEQAYTGGGHYNDLDGLQLGHRLNDQEERTHFAMWCIYSSPIVIGQDLRTLSEKTLTLLRNADLVAMNQDRLGLGAPVVQREGEVYVVAKDMETLHGKKRAVAVLNISDRKQTIEVCLKSLGFVGGVNIHDCFSKADTKSEGNTVSVTVDAHDTQAFFFVGERQDKTLYQAEEAWLNEYQRLANLPTAEAVDASKACLGAMVQNIGNSERNYLEWRDVYVTKGGKYKLTFAYAAAKERDLKVNVNGKDVKTFTNLNTGSWDAQWSTCSVVVNLKAGSNKVRLGNAEAFAPNIDYMRIEAVK